MTMTPSGFRPTSWGRRFQTNREFVKDQHLVTVSDQPTVGSEDYLMGVTRGSRGGPNLVSDQPSWGDQPRWRRP